MKYRKLRIAWSVAWGLLAVLLCVLWARSYWWIDYLYVKVPDPQRNLVISSGLGGTTWYTNQYPSWSPAWTHRYWRTESDSVTAATEGLDVLWFNNLYTFEFFSRPSEPYWSRQLALPHWLLIAAFTAIAVAPWIHWRFSLRTLLIGTTLIAMVLGMIAWLSRRETESAAAFLHLSKVVDEYSIALRWRDTDGWNELGRNEANTVLRILANSKDLSFDSDGSIPFVNPPSHWFQLRLSDNDRQFLVWVGLGNSAVRIVADTETSRIFDCPDYNALLKVVTDSVPPIP